MPTASEAILKDPLRKVRTLWHCSRLRSVALLPMIDRGDIRCTDRCSNIWASLPGAGVMAVFERKADSLIAKFKEAGVERSERLMYEQSHRDYLRIGYLHHRLPVMGC